MPESPLEESGVREGAKLQSLYGRKMEVCNIRGPLIYCGHFRELHIFEQFRNGGCLIKTGLCETFSQAIYCESEGLLNVYLMVSKLFNI